MVQKKREYIWFSIALTSIVVVGCWILLKKKQPKVDLKKFDSPDLPGSGVCMDKKLIKMLLQLQNKSGYPVFDNINSGARTAYWNKKVGGVSNSSHKIPTCKAVDIHTPTKSIRNKIVVIAKLVGFKRIGVGKTFVHLDNDHTKRQNIAWGYPSGAKPPINPFI
ncbi:D-Ala-D-Ala carboxypeptidase family metallohydrolase [Aquimarina sp. TRL1]|uniref:D-Ala-D-Ala carboxypeptidase family metallohydrolase n=1 Tax=Aquimarina sp. (strain TRL1) TaxID=2736252 RepID=UPI0020CB44E8|nr:D-Ala-D-Ala carboxypeptidase family metallohydrolase [Aquimarina sp. TRL1]